MRVSGQPELVAATGNVDPAAVVWLISARRFGEKAFIPYSKCERTSAPYSGMKANFERPCKESLITKIGRLALFAASVYRTEGENALSV